MIAKILKILGVLVGIAALIGGFSIGERINLFNESYAVMVAVIIWVCGLISAAVLYAFGELLDQHYYTNYLLGRHFGIRQENREEKSSPLVDRHHKIKL